MFQYFDIPRLQKLLTVLQEAAVCPAPDAAQPQALYAPGKPDYTAPQRLAPFAPGARWGGDDADAWFRTVYTVPAAWAQRAVWLEVFTGREDTKDIINPQLLALVDGREVQGVDRFHPCVCITQGAAAGTQLTVDFDAWFGLAAEGASWTQADREPCVFRLRAFVRDDAAERLYWDMKTPCDTAALLPPDNGDRLRIVKHLTRAANLLDLRVPRSDAFAASVRAALAYLETEFYGAECAANGPQPTAYVIGHTHIDVAWLWALRHTRRKAARSFATALSLLDAYPEYEFMSSQPQLYAFVKEAHPALYERIRAQAAARRWHPDGAMWLEADCNLAGGEALVRQIVYGKRFFREEFGVDSRVLWLPDVFGYCAALPQICKKAGVDYFMTTKISWNDTNLIPYDTFYWCSPDGSRVLTHFIPTRDYGCAAAEGDTQTPIFTTYNGELSPNHVMGGWKRYSSKDISDCFLISYGHGDGGGGATREMLEQQRRMARGIPGCPATKHSSPLAFFEQLEKTVKDNPRTPAWHGELYFEYHRGTYTSAARTKQGNRRAESALCAAEVACTLALLRGDAALLSVSQRDMTAQLQALWQRLLLNQFHDILPGSSITQVYDESEADHAAILAGAHTLTETALSAMGAADCAAAPPQNTGALVFNALGFARGGVVTLPESCTAAYLRDAQGNILPVQSACLPCEAEIATGRAAVPGVLPQLVPARICALPHAPAMGCTALSPCAAPTVAFAPTLTQTGPNTFTNGVLTLRFTAQGQIASLFDEEARRELLPPGACANMLECYEDRPHAYDAWDLNVYHTEHRWMLSAEAAPALTENGPVRAVLRVTYRWLSSVLMQDIVLYPHNRRVEFVTTVNWQEENLILKAAFPVDVQAEKASFDVQFGTVERPTHKNTTWDFAKFETCAHKWADLSETGYGVSLLSDCKYGYDVHDGALRISLLKSAMFPARGVDKGLHRFTYALYPHAGSWREGGTHLAAYALNAPLLALSAPPVCTAAQGECSAAGCDTPGVMVEVFKPAENGQGFVLRAYELFGQRADARFTTAFSGTVQEADLLEQPLPNGAIPAENGSFSAILRPYEIKTFLLGV